MLKELPTETIERNLIRLAVCSNPDRFFVEQDLDAESIEETNQLLKVPRHRHPTTETH